MLQVNRFFELFFTSPNRPNNRHSRNAQRVRNPLLAHVGVIIHVCNNRRIVVLHKPHQLLISEKQFIRYNVLRNDAIIRTAYHNARVLIAVVEKMFWFFRHYDFLSLQIPITPAPQLRYHLVVCNQAQP